MKPRRVIDIGGYTCPYPPCTNTRLSDWPTIAAHLNMHVEAAHRDDPNNPYPRNVIDEELLP